MQSSDVTPPPHPTVDGHGRRVLVVEDDLAIRVLLKEVLRRVGFEVDLAEDGAVGLDLYQTRDYDLVLLDLMMPRVNGYAFLERVNRGGRDHRKSHIIIFTAAGNRGIEKVPEGAVCSAILKPFDLDQFLVLVAACMDGEHA